MGKENKYTRQKKKEHPRQPFSDMRKWEEEMERMFGDLWKEESLPERKRPEEGNRN
jgi:hypothetical protein